MDREANIMPIRKLEALPLGSLVDMVVDDASTPIPSIVLCRCDGPKRGIYPAGTYTVQRADGEVVEGVRREQLSLQSARAPPSFEVGDLVEGRWQGGASGAVMRDWHLAKVVAIDRTQRTCSLRYDGDPEDEPCVPSTYIRRAKA